MAAFDTVQKIVDECRRLLQDQVVPYRYPDVDLVAALNSAMLEVRRLRPDLLLPLFEIPEYSAGSMGAAVTIEPMYIPAVVYFIVGHAQLRDDEPTMDQRAAAFKQSFAAKLLTSTG
jgi:hypothetical protein